MERELFDVDYFGAEVRTVVIDRHPNCHCMGYYKTVQLVHIQALVNIALKFDTILATTPLVPVVEFEIKPALLSE